MFVEFNPNPKASRVGDCAIRAVAKALNISWEEAFVNLSIFGLMMGDLPSSNNVIGAYLRENGFKRAVLPNSCPNCYTVRNFCEEHPKGTFILMTNGHIVTIIDGDYFDTWDSGEEVPIFYWRKEK